MGQGGAYGGNASEGAATRILTTHSVEEAEALCDRVGVLLAGKLQCIGSSLHLRSRFARFLRADVKLLPPADGDVAALLAAAEAAGASSTVSSDALGSALEPMAAESARRCAGAESCLAACHGASEGCCRAAWSCPVV